MTRRSLFLAGASVLAFRETEQARVQRELAKLRRLMDELLATFNNHNHGYDFWPTRKA